MKHGFVKVAAVTPKIKVADPKYNAEQIRIKLDEAYEKKAKVIVFPELCLTGYTCGDLFLQETLIGVAEQVVLEIAAVTEGKDMLSGFFTERDRGAADSFGIVYKRA